MTSVNILKTNILQFILSEICDDIFKSTCLATIFSVTLISEVGERCSITVR